MTIQDMEWRFVLTKMIKEEYFVLYRRDLEAEKNLKKQTRGKMLFDAAKEFKDYNRALIHANANLPAILAKKTPLSEEEKAKIRDEQRPYIVAGYFESKYRHHSYDGSSDNIPTNEVVRCSEGELEKAVEKVSSEGATKIRVGIELRVLGGTLL
jgi:hypothetical protein